VKFFASPQDRISEDQVSDSLHCGISIQLMTAMGRDRFKKSLSMILLLRSAAMPRTFSTASVKRESALFGLMSASTRYGHWPRGRKFRQGRRPHCSSASRFTAGAAGLRQYHLVNTPSD
jgi:hypothetical protein